MCSTHSGRNASSSLVTLLLASSSYQKLSRSTRICVLVPLAATSNRWSMRLLGRDWKRLHRLITPILVLVGLHLFTVGPAVFGWVFLGAAGVLRLLRVRRVVRWFAARRTAVRPC